QLFARLVGRIAIEIVDRWLRDAADLRVGLGPRHTRLQPGDDLVVLPAAFAGPARPYWGPQVHGSASREAIGHHANNRVRLSAQRDRTAECAWIAVEQPRPQLMAENRGSGTAGPILVGGELAPDGGRHAEHAEERRRHALLLHVLGMRADDHVHAGRSKSAGSRRQ